MPEWCALPESCRQLTGVGQLLRRTARCSVTRVGGWSASLIERKLLVVLRGFPTPIVSWWNGGGYSKLWLHGGAGGAS